MKRILFVDDEPRILEGLRDQLHRFRKTWTMAFAESGARALEVLAKEPFDIIVSDMRMPGMDGATLLKIVQEQYPSMVRIILSGHAELEAVVRALPVAHQYLAKPCPPELLQNVVERAGSLQALIADERLRSTLGRMQKLPSLPKVYATLTRLMGEEKTTMNDIAHIVEQDVAICAKLLQLVNSAYFSLSRPITSVKQAVSYLGFNGVRNLVLGTEVFAGNAFTGVPVGYLEETQRHAMFVATVGARIMGTDKAKADDAFTAGLLHDVGKLVLAAEYPGRYGLALRTAGQREEHVVAAEREIFGVSHAEVGGFVLGIWGLPFPIVEAVAHHHDPQTVPRIEIDILTAVSAGNALWYEQVGGEQRETDLDWTAGHLVGADTLVRWRSIALESARAA